MCMTVMLKRNHKKKKKSQKDLNMNPEDSMNVTCYTPSNS